MLECLDHSIRVPYRCAKAAEQASGVEGVWPKQPLAFYGVDLPFEHLSTHEVDLPFEHLLTHDSMRSTSPSNIFRLMRLPVCADSYHAGWPQPRALAPTGGARAAAPADIFSAARGSFVSSPGFWQLKQRTVGIEHAIILNVL